MSTLFVLFESASGYALLEQTESDEIGQYLEEMQSAMCDLARLSKVLKLKAFVPFQSAEEALSAANDTSEGMLNETLKNFLEMNLPSGKKAEKKGKILLGVLDSKLGSAINEELGIKCSTSDPVPELCRAVRLHLSRYIKGLEESDQAKASLGLAHSYSRSKVKFNVNRQDNMIIQSISLLDTLDKDINTFSMRIKEWYGWHFPELVKIVGDNYKYARCVKKVQVRPFPAMQIGEADWCLEQQCLRAGLTRSTAHVMDYTRSVCMLVSLHTLTHHTCAGEDVAERRLSRHAAGDP
jgi:nucleolar protein 56